MFKKNLYRFGFAVMLVTILWLSLAPIALALGNSYQPVEWETYQSSRPRYSLSYAGLVKGCKQDQPNNYDQKFWININASYNPDNYRIYSYDSTIQQNFSGKSPMGRDLSTIRPYLCLGQWDVFWAGGGSNVASKLFVWIK